MIDKNTDSIKCNLKELRQKKGLTQSELADMLDMKRQAMYDIESGKYFPNTFVSLKLAKILGCTIEDIFEEKNTPAQKIEMADNSTGENRIMVAKVRDRLIGYPLKGKYVIDSGLQPADGIYSNGSFKLLKNETDMENSLLIVGCDPALGILTNRLSASIEASQHYKFSSSKQALELVSSGKAHIGATHFHNNSKKEANLQIAEKIMKGQKFNVIAFSEFEEGIMTAPGNPRNIKNAADLAGRKIHFVNREKGAALRSLLDDHLRKAGIPVNAVKGYEISVKSHAEGAEQICFGLADAALGLRVVADIYELGFVPLSTVRCDLVIPADFMRNTAVKAMLDMLQSKKLRLDMQGLGGYSTNRTGDVIK